MIAFVKTRNHNELRKNVSFTWLLSFVMRNIIGTFKLFDIYQEVISTPWQYDFDGNYGVNLHNIIICGEQFVILF